jgi:ABC-type transport system involved in multi-copper enzyme maturation permease subunit
VKGRTRLDKSPLIFWFHAVKTLAAKVSRRTLQSLGIFVAMAVSLTASSILLVNLLQYAEKNIVLVHKQPLTVSTATSAIIVSLYLALLAVVRVSREYDKGRIELLLYGPVDESAFILGHFLAFLVVFAVTLGVTFIWAVLCILFLNLSFGMNILALFLSTLLVASELVALGVLTAVWGGKTRGALVIFTLLILFFGGIQVADSVVINLVNLEQATANDPWILVRDVLVTLDRITHWVSPFAQFLGTIQGIFTQSSRKLFLNVSLMFIEVLVFLSGSIWILRRKGVRT